LSLGLFDFIPLLTFILKESVRFNKFVVESEFLRSHIFFSGRVWLREGNVVLIGWWRERREERDGKLRDSVGGVCYCEWEG